MGELLKIGDLSENRVNVKNHKKGVGFCKSMVEYDWSVWHLADIDWSKRLRLGEIHLVA
jgi:hypothetical protein